MHGKISSIKHRKSGVFRNIRQNFKATRYHSLVVDKATLPSCFEITALSKENEIMGVSHKDYILEGVQFHPEAVLTDSGHLLIKNFIQMCNI